jgi:hypothetical protein
LIERLVSINPVNAEWVKEAGYANGNLCVIALEPPRDPARALLLCTVALERMEQAQRLGGTTPATVEAVLNRHLWMMKAWYANGRWDRVLFHKKRQEELTQALLRSDPANVDYRDIWMKAQFGIAEILIKHGDVTEARQRLRQAGAVARSLHNYDPTNAAWVRWQQRISASLTEGERP